MEYSSCRDVEKGDEVIESDVKGTGKCICMVGPRLGGMEGEGHAGAEWAPAACVGSPLAFFPERWVRLTFPSAQ